MQFEKLDNYKIDKNDVVSVKEMGNVVEVSYVAHPNKSSTIRKIDNDTYLVLSTGEIKEVEHISNRSENKAQVAQSLKRLRDYINTNVTDVSKCKWITLTYKENMQDSQKLYKDFEKFIKKFRYSYGHVEYIVAMEPQARGAWHCHVIIIFEDTAPFIANNIIQRMWGHGFTKTQKLDNIDNIGAYLTAYLGDMELSEFRSCGIEYKHITIKEVKEIGNQKLNEPKKFVKGGRLYMYPPKFNLYRISRGIKKPVKKYMEYSKAKEKVGSAQPTFSKAIKMIDTDNDFSNIIVYESYNTKRNYSIRE